MTMSLSIRITGKDLASVLRSMNKPENKTLGQRSANAAQNTRNTHFKRSRSSQ